MNQVQSSKIHFCEIDKQPKAHETCLIDPWRSRVKYRYNKEANPWGDPRGEARKSLQPFDKLFYNLQSFHTAFLIDSSEEIQLALKICRSIILESLGVSFVNFSSI